HQALGAECTSGTDDLGAECLEWRAADRDTGTAPPATAITRMALPDWLGRPVAAEAPGLRLTPSTVVGDDDATAVPVVPRLASTDARARGVQIHRLLQSLPEIDSRDRAAVGAAYLAAHGAADGERILREVLAVLADDRFAAV